MRGSLPALLLFGLLLSGCVAEQESTDAADTASGAAPEQASSNTRSAAPAPGQENDTGASPQSNATATANAAPTIANFTANATGLNVTFTFTATDADNDTLTYTLSFGDNSTNATGPLPNGTANVTYLFAAAGAYNVTLVVQDGALEANHTVQVNLSAPAAGGSQSFTASWLLGAPGCALILTGSGSTDGVYGVFRAIDAATWGQPYVITYVGIPDSLGYDYAFYKGSTRIGVVAASGNPPTSSGTVPEDVTGIAIRNCGVRGTSATYTAG